MSKATERTWNHSFTVMGIPLYVRYRTKPFVTVESCSVEGGLDIWPIVGQEFRQGVYDAVTDRMERSKGKTEKTGTNGKEQEEAQ